MNINYEDIITKANERAERIKDFLAFTKEADERAHDIVQGLLYFSNLGKMVTAIDAEGKSMLGGVGVRAQCVGQYASDAHRYLTINAHDGSDTRSIFALVEMLK